MVFNLVRIGIVIAFPLLCVLWTAHLGGDGAEKIRGVEFSALCTAQELVRGIDAQTNCLASDWLWLFRAVAWTCLVLALTPVVIFMLVSALCGTGQRMTAALFPRLIPLSTMFVVFNLLAQGVLLILAAAAFYLVYLGNPPLAILAATAIGVTGVASAVIIGASNVNVSGLLDARALSVTRKEAPELWAMVDEIAGALEAPPPDHIVVGLKPEFWAVAGKVRMTGEGLDGLCTGTVLHLSQPYLHVLSMAELVAMIGHELAHFRAPGASYSKKFLPVYTALRKARYDLDDHDDLLNNKPLFSRVLVTVSKFPARAQLGLLSAAFGSNARRIGRQRGRAADDAAAGIAEPEALVRGLLKLALFDGLWQEVLDEQAERIERILPRTAHLARHFGDMARIGVTSEELDAGWAAALRARAMHPYDQHPPLAARARALRVKLDAISADALRPGPEDRPVETLIPAPVRLQLEAALMGAEFHAMREAGRIKDTPGMATGMRADPLYHAVYAILAALVAIAPDPAERFREAAARGEQEMTDFDRLVFSEYCAGHREMPEPPWAAKEILRLAGPEAGQLTFEIVEDLLYEDEEDIRDWLRGLLKGTP